MIEISVLSSAHYLSKDDFSLDTTDFQMLNLPTPNFKGGPNYDVILIFNDENEIAHYSEELLISKIIKPLENVDLLKNKKIDRIQKSIELYFEHQKLKEYFKDKSFLETQSGFTYSFKHENTLQISNSVANRFEYSIILKDDVVYLSVPFDTELLEIQRRMDHSTIDLITQFSRKLKLNLLEK